jgi:holo-[acyl-carrier protein] synthase
MKQIVLGIDIIEIRRIQIALKDFKERFLKRIFTQREIDLYQDRVDSLAVRFAAKEAVFKSLSKPGLYFSWQEVEILTAEDGRPVVKLYGEILKRANELGLNSMEISLSHSRDNAIAMVIGLT